MSDFSETCGPCKAGDHAYCHKGECKCWHRGVVAKAPEPAGLCDCECHTQGFDWCWKCRTKRHVAPSAASPVTEEAPLRDEKLKEQFAAARKEVAAMPDWMKTQKPLPGTTAANVSPILPKESGDQREECGAPIPERWRDKHRLLLGLERSLHDYNFEIALLKELAVAEEALRRVERWEIPETGAFWDDKTPMSYEAVHGSNGTRDFIREIAREALHKNRAI